MKQILKAQLLILLLVITTSAFGQAKIKREQLLGNWEGTVVYDTSKMKLNPEQVQDYKKLSGFKVTMSFGNDGKYSGEQFGEFVANKAEGTWSLKGKELTLKLVKVDGKEAKLPDIRLKVVAATADTLKLEQVGPAVGGKMTMKRVNPKA